MRFGYTFGPPAPPRSDLVAALQQRMVALGYTPGPAGVYGGAEDAVLQSYADMSLPPDYDRFDLNSVIVAILPVMDDDIAVGGQWVGHNTGITGSEVNITGRVGGGSMLGLGLLALLGIYLYTR